MYEITKDMSRTTELKGERQAVKEYFIFKNINRSGREREKKVIKYST
jgi:hypothetical protein